MPRRSPRPSKREVGVAEVAVEARLGLGQVHLLQVAAGDVDGVAVLADLAVLQPDGPVAQRLHLAQAVGHQHDGDALAAQLVDVVEAAALEALVADRDHLVEQEDLRVHVDGDREPEPHLHAAGVDAHGRVDELADVGEVDDVVDPALDLLAPGCPGSRR